MNILLVGFGNLGYRHFQSFLKIYSQAKFYIVEQNIKNIKYFIEKDYEYRFIKEKLVISNSIEKFNKVSFKVCIVSTPSLPRFEILNKILDLNIELIILEKLLFPSLSFYKKFDNKFLNFPKNIFVNCPKSEYKFYKNIKYIIQNDKPINIECLNITDIGSNSIHWIDLAYFLTGRLIENSDRFRININELYRSKRQGYYDFTGDIKIKTKKFNLVIKSSKNINNLQEEEFLLNNDNLIIKINEQNSSMLIKKDSKDSVEKINVPYQSELSSKYLESFEKGNINLTNLYDSLLIHKKFFVAFEEALLKIKNNNSNFSKDYYLT